MAFPFHLSIRFFKRNISITVHIYNQTAGTKPFSSGLTKKSDMKTELAVQTILNSHLNQFNETQNVSNTPVEYNENKRKQTETLSP